MTLLTLGRNSENPVSAGKEDWTGKRAGIPEILLLGAASPETAVGLSQRPLRCSVCELMRSENAVYSRSRAGSRSKAAVLAERRQS